MEIMSRKLHLNNIVIESRDSDNFINATQLCKAGGKEFKHWISLESTKELIKTLEDALKNEAEISNKMRNDLDLSVVEISTTLKSNEVKTSSINLVDIKRGGNAKLQGSWIHPDLAVQLAQWISPVFSIQVSRWVRELVVTGNVSIDSQKTNQELIELSKQLQIKNDEIKTKDVEMIQKEQELQIAKSKNLNLVSKITTDKLHKIDGWIYLATCTQLSKDNYFRLGRTDDLKKRLTSYNTGRVDLIYYVFKYKTEKVALIELVLQRLLIEFRWDPKKDIYILPWPIISKFVEYVCESFHNGIILQKNKLTELNWKYDADIIIPNKLCINNESQVIIEYADVRETDDESQETDSSSTETDDESQETCGSSTENILPLPLIITDETIDGASKLKIIPTKPNRILKPTLQCNSPYKNHQANRNNFQVIDGVRAHICNDCREEKVATLVNIALDELKGMYFNDLKKADSLKMKDVKRELNLITFDDLYKKSVVLETENYKKCCSMQTHKNTLDQWNLKTNFYIRTRTATGSSTVSSYCTPCEVAISKIKKK